MVKTCQFCSKKVDGRIWFSRSWCCWACLEKFGLEDDDLTIYYPVSIRNKIYLEELPCHEDQL
jgi:hypothetical protein